MPDSIGDLIALFLGVAVLWFLVGIFSHDVRSGDHRWTGSYSDQKMAEVGQVCAALDAGGSQTAEGACSARLLASLPR